MPWLAAGCVVPEPEKFREPERSPPILDLNGAAPSIFELIEVRGPTQRALSIGVRSEDHGEQLAGALYVNYKTATESNVGYQVLAPSTLDDPLRRFQFTPTLQIPCTPDPDTNAGCCAHLTLVATHLSNISTEGGLIQPDPSLSQGDLALATWWLAVDSPTTQPSLIHNCPRRAVSP
jgi:hypothetical protein